MVVSVVLASHAALAAQSIRVLLSADVYRLDVQADGAVWLTDSSRDGRAIRSDARITAYSKGFLVNGTRTRFWLSRAWRHVGVKTARARTSSDTGN